MSCHACYFPNLFGNKKRLYIGLFVRGTEPRLPGAEDAYHWAFLVGPKEGTKTGLHQGIYHIKEEIIEEGESFPKVAQPQWLYFTEEDRMSMLLVRIVVAKVKDLERLEKIFLNIPVRRGEKGYTCMSWVREAFEAAVNDERALGSRMGSWEDVREQAMRYIAEKKAAHNFDGRGKKYDITKPATWDMLQNKETLA